MTKATAIQYEAARKPLANALNEIEWTTGKLQDLLAQVPQGPIVYRLRWKSPTSRVAGQDDDGTLYIGETGFGRVRIKTFVSAARRGDASHRAGIDYYAYNLHNQFPLDEVLLDYVAVKEKHHAEAIELALIEEYRWRFKENPPMNGSQGKWRKVEFWIEASHAGRQARKPEPYDGWLNIGDLIPQWLVHP